MVFGEDFNQFYTQASTFVYIFLKEQCPNENNSWHNLPVLRLKAEHMTILTTDCIEAKLKMTMNVQNKQIKVPYRNLCQMDTRG